jgi:hypothetical protein
MSVSCITVSDGSHVVFDKRAKAAYILSAHSLSPGEKDPVKRAQELVKAGNGVRLNKAQLAAVNESLANIGLLGGSA